MSIYDGGSGGHQQPHPAEALEISARHVDRMMGLDAGAARSDSPPWFPPKSLTTLFLPDEVFTALVSDCLAVVEWGEGEFRDFRYYTCT